MLERIMIEILIASVLSLAMYLVLSEDEDEL